MRKCVELNFDGALLKKELAWMPVVLPYSSLWESETDLIVVHFP